MSVARAKTDFVQAQRVEETSGNRTEHKQAPKARVTRPPTTAQDTHELRNAPTYSNTHQAS